jgi:RND superfamily putative drug exporter
LAIWGWIAFVVDAVIVAGAIGTKTLNDGEEGVGESARADRVLDSACPPPRTTTAECSPSSPTGG